MNRFKLDVEKFIKTELPKEIERTHRATHLELLKRVVFRTPVDRGRARSNWQSTTNTFARTSVPTRSVSQVLAEAENLQIKAFSVSFLSNNVPYTVFLEAGSSKQAPQGMVAVSIAELNNE